MRPSVVDLETFEIKRRPHYPPDPVGVAIKHPGKEPEYYAFKHRTENNATFEEAKEAILEAYNNPDGVVFHNAKFDLCVIKDKLGIPPPPWYRVHDTRLLLFFHNPYAASFGLKEAAKDLLSMPPEEQDAVADWLFDNRPDGLRISKTRTSKNSFAKYIALAPGELVGRYAKGDVIRTELLFYKLYEDITSKGMLGAYDRERKLLSILMEMDEQGMLVDSEALDKDVAFYENYLCRIDEWLVGKLGVINFDSPAQLLSALLDKGLVDNTKLLKTEKGGYSTNKKSLELAITNSVLGSILQYRPQLSTCLSTFMKPWLETASATGGYIYTDWVQVKRGDEGARTGRLSSTPNFLNIPNEFPPLFAHEKEGLPNCPIPGLPQLPFVRSYIKPFPGHAIIGRDYSSQEHRVLAHYAGGNLAKVYCDNPWADLHSDTQRELAAEGMHYQRKAVKAVNFGLLYGMGVSKLSLQLGCSYEEAAKLVDSILSTYSGLADMKKDMQLRERLNKPIRTWGGRVYYCESPKFVDGRIRTFGYKLINTLIQGSSADITKQAVINFSKVKSSESKILMIVHDEIVVSVPKNVVHEEMSKLKEAMNSVPLDVPLKTEGYVCYNNWFDCIDYDKKDQCVA